MKKIKICIAAAVISASLLSGCGMARDGYINDTTEPTRAPMESPYITATPRPTERPSQNNGTGNGTAGESTGEGTTGTTFPSMTPNA